jgi:hypothetical protein
MIDILEHCRENNIEVIKYPTMIKVGNCFDVYSGKKRTVFNLFDKTFHTFKNDEDRFYYILDNLVVRPPKQKKPTYKQVSASIKANENYRLGFGKWKGFQIKDIPLNYLAWCCDNIPNINNNVRKYVDSKNPNQ